MEKTTIFENLKCWRSSRKLLMTVHSVSKAGRLSNEFFLKNQLKRKSVVAMSTIAEGFDKTSCSEFIAYLNSSHKSIAELKCMLVLLADKNFLATEKMHEVVHQVANETSNHTLDLITYLQNSNS